MSDTVAFPRDYFAARARFRAEAVRHGWQLEWHVEPNTGPYGEELTIDVASLGSPDAANVLLTTSGLHGVEGPVGSAIQSTLMSTSAEWLASSDDVRICFVHALNPYAYSWSRRCDEHNIDPNRNFLPPGDAYRGSAPDYAKHQAWLNPRRPLPWWDPLHLKALWELWRSGVPRLKDAIAGGQFDYPKGLFYGGDGPCAVHQFLDDNLGRWIRGATRVLHLDFHTGLGQWGRCKLLVDDALIIERHSWLQRFFGPDLIQQCDPHGVAYRSRGALGPWCESRFPEVDYTYLCVEFGTYRLLRVLLGLRAENQAHNWERLSEWSSIKAKRRLLELFSPRSPTWRYRTHQQGVSLVHSARQALNTTLKMSMRPVHESLSARS